MTPPADNKTSIPDGTDGGSSFCAVCARRGPTCCQRTEVYVTPGDVRRIAANENVDASTPFHERRPPARPDDWPDPERDAPWAALLDADGQRRILRHTENGDCVFLRADGCALDERTRPLVCRLYPFAYGPDGVSGVDAWHCAPPARDDPSMALALLGMDRTRAEADRRQLYREIAEDLADGDDTAPPSTIAE